MLLRYLQVRTRTCLDVLPPQLPQRGTARHVPILGDGARKALAIRVQCFAKEGLGCSDSTVATQQEIDRLAVLVDRSIQVVPLPANAHVRLVAPPRSIDAPTKPVPALLVGHEPNRTAKNR